MSLLAKDEVEKYFEAGRIASNVLKKAKKYIAKNKPLIVICEGLEREIISQGGKLAFPVNVSLNQIAAHYTSPIGDEMKIPERALIKIDLGVHVDGYISDIAQTFLVGATKTYIKLKEIAELALDKAIAIIKPGIRPTDIGTVIEKTIVNEGLTPITDLTGHVIERWKLHSGISIPNYKPKIDIFSSKLKEGQVLAIEPFVTTAEGSRQVSDHNYTYIFSQIGSKAKSAEAKIILEEIKKYKKLPFALRWLGGLLPETRIFEGLKELIYYKSVNRYPMLLSKSNTPVSQAEHTVLMTENGCEIITQS